MIMLMPILTSQEIANFLSQSTLKGWKKEQNAIEKKFVFNDFLEVMHIINKIVLVAEKLNHHPEWKNVYNQLTIRLTTHDSKGITLKDIQLAQEIEKIIQKNKQL